MKRSEVLRKLEERLARGEISEPTYLGIKARYEAEPEEPETPPAPEPSLEESIHEAVTRSTEEAFRASHESMRAVHGSMRGMEIAGIGVKHTGEAIKILGSGVVTGDPVKTVEFKAAGSARVRGPLEAETVKVAGACDFDGDVHCVDFRTSGSSRIAGALQAEDVNISGGLDVAKDLSAVDITVSGALRVDGDVHGQDFRSTGSLQIQGALKAPDVDIELAGASRIGTIESQDVSVRAAGGFLRARGELTVDKIVAQDIDLVGTVAGYVQGGDVRVGPHCRIDVVVAKDLMVHESSEVKERRAPTS